MVPEGLQERGTELWLALSGGGELVGAQRALVLEACRCADRLERIDRFLNGNEQSWFDFIEPEDGSGRVRVVVDNALSEARQQQLALRQLLTTIGIEKAPAAKGRKSDDLAARRAARIAAAQGPNAT